jgi:hypothetical protein
LLLHFLEHPVKLLILEFDVDVLSFELVNLLFDLTLRNQFHFHLFYLPPQSIILSPQSIILLLQNLNLSLQNLNLLLQNLNLSLQNVNLSLQNVNRLRLFLHILLPLMHLLAITVDSLFV